VRVNLARQVMSGDVHPYETRFRPLRPASRGRLIAALLVGPCLWIVALELTAIVLHRGDAIQYALAIAGASFVVAFLVLAVLLRGRRREERRHAAGR
jgi:hypothetical protein